MIKINGKQYEIKFFPDGTLNMTDTGITTSKTVITWLYENLTEQVVLYNLVQYLHDIRRVKVVLKLPYLPNARMDRTKNPNKEVHTLKYFCKFINDLQFESVEVVDVHSPVAMSLLERAVDHGVHTNITKLMHKSNYDYMFFPDKGALDRYEYLTIRTPFYGVKARDWDTGDITGYQVENPYKVAPSHYAGKSILIVDDICSYGTTFYHAAQALKDLGFGNIDLYVTHAENSILKGKLMNDENISRIFTTPTIFTGEHPKIMVMAQD